MKTRETMGPECKRLIVMTGLPYSGKSSWARRQGFPVVSGDSIRLALHGQRFEPLAEPMVHAIARIMVRALFLAGHDVVIMDETCVTNKCRREWLSPDWLTEFKILRTTAAECLARASGDAHILPVIERMAREWEPLDSSLREYV
jgi:predicted kinase